MNNEKVAIVTGGNRGLGKECCRQLAEKGYIVVLCSRDLANGEAASKEMQGSVVVRPLEVTNQEQCKALVKGVKEEFGRIDALINNAGILLEGDPTNPKRAPEGDLEEMRQTYEVNTLAPYFLIQQVAPIMREQGEGCIVNVSSGAGQLTSIEGGPSGRNGYPAYRMSKAALNAVTCVWASDLEGSGVLINSCCPGWVHTDMGGLSAPRGLEEGADTIVWLATLPKNGPTGRFFRDRTEIPW